MVVVTRSIHIDVPPERVFALVADPVARSALNPHATPIRVEVEGGGSLRAGSVCHFRLRIGDRIADYRTRVTEFVTNRRIVSVSDSAVPFQVALETMPQSDGTLLTQTERFEAPEEVLRSMLPRTAENRILELAYRLTLFLDLESASRMRARREEMLAAQLGPNLDRWLAAIRDQLQGVRRTA